MQLISQEGTFLELRVDTLDDLWILSQFLSPNDILYATSIRKVKIGGDSSTKQVKKLIPVELLLKKATFELDQLKVQGSLINETEFTSKGQHHSVNYKLGDVLKVEKKEILAYQQHMLDSAISSKKSFNLLVSLDKDEFLVCEFTNFNFRVLFHEKGLGSKKYHHAEINEEEQKFKLLQPFLEKQYSQIILTGPGIYKEKFKQYLSSKTSQKIDLFSYPEISSSSISKVLEKLTKSGILESGQLSKEQDSINELLKELQTTKKCSYGTKEVEEAILSGRASKVLLSTKFLDKSKEDESFETISSLLKTAEQLKSDLTIISSKNEPGKILDGLSGIACITRY